MNNTTPEGRWVTEDNLSSIPAILSWIIGVAVFLCVLAKEATKLSMGNRLAVDDYTILISLAFSIGMIASVSVAAYNGLGRYANVLNADQFKVLEKSLYATDLLYVGTLLFSKLSMLAIIKFITPIKRHVILLYTIAGFLVVWTISSLFAAAFQCPVPACWTIFSDRCFDQKVFWLYYTAMNIFTEVVLMAAAILVLKDVRVPMPKKMTLGTIFGLRLVVIGASVADIVYRARAARTAQDGTFTLWPVMVCRQFVQGLSIIFSCVPFMKPFFGAFLYSMPRQSVSDINSSSSVKKIPFDGRHSQATNSSGVLSWRRFRQSRRQSNSIESQDTSFADTIRATISFDVHTETRNQ